MRTSETNGFEKVLTAEAQRTETVVDSASAPPAANKTQPYIPLQGKPKLELRENARVIVVGGFVAIALILFALAHLPHSQRPSPAAKYRVSNGRAADNVQADRLQSGSSSVVPIIDTGRSQDESDSSLVHPEQIARTATKPAADTPPATLGDIRPFDNHTWEPAPYQPGAEAADPGDSPAPLEGAETKGEREALDKASLVFVRNDSSPTKAATQNNEALPQIGIGLAPGTRLRARLESAVNTAVQTPLVAVIEYNYEENGEIVVPAGAKAFGRLQSADRSGYIGVRFDSLQMPDGSSVSIDAAATNLKFGPLKGMVEGKHTGKNVLVRSMAGVGEIAATLVGRGSLNQPLSESDLLRERVSNNIGQASDEEVERVAVTEHLVVSVQANTEIYVVLEKPTRAEVAEPILRPTTQSLSQSQRVQELKQLLQLQRELNEGASAATSNE